MFQERPRLPLQQCIKASIARRSWERIMAMVKILTRQQRKKSLKPLETKPRQNIVTLQTSKDKMRLWLHMYLTFPRSPPNPSTPRKLSPCHVGASKSSMNLVFPSLQLLPSLKEFPSRGFQPGRAHCLASTMNSRSLSYQKRTRFKSTASPRPPRTPS